MSDLFMFWAHHALYPEHDLYRQNSWWFQWLRAWRVIGRYHTGMHLVESAVDEVP